MSIAAASSQTIALGQAQTMALSGLKSAADQQVALLAMVAEQSAATVAAAAGGRGQIVDVSA